MSSLQGNQYGASGAPSATIGHPAGMVPKDPRTVLIDVIGAPRRCPVQPSTPLGPHQVNVITIIQCIVEAPLDVCHPSLSADHGVATTPQGPTQV
jgi:hypothetical protein